MIDLIAAAVDQAPIIVGSLIATMVICVIGGRAFSKRRG